MSLRHGSDYGGFSTDGWHYEIRTPSPPREWFNVLFNRRFLTTVSQVGRGESATVGTSAARVSLAHRAFYVLDRDTKAIWSPTGAPAGPPLIEYRCVHRPDCTVIESERAGIAVRIRVFVPVEGNVSIWTVTVRNHTAERCSLSLFSYLPVRAADDRPPSEAFVSSRYDPDPGAVMVGPEPGPGSAGREPVTYVASRPRPDHTEGSEEVFLGGAGRWDRPAAVLAGRLGDGPGLSGILTAALQHDIVLDEGGVWTVCLAVGHEDSREEAVRSAAQFTDAEGVDGLFEQCWLFWQDLISPGGINTPDEAINLALNVWLKRQLVMQVRGRQWADAIHIGEALQDAAALLPEDAAPCREALLTAFTTQDPNGYIPRDRPTSTHSAQPLAGARVRSCATGGRDAPIWAAWALAAYVNETGDEAFLRESLPFRSGKRPAGVVAHAVAGLRYLAEGVGQHGLCLLNRGDWNQALESAGRDGRGESVWSSMALVFAARALAQVVERTGNRGTAEELESIAEGMTEALNAAAWDGNWYIRGYTDGGLRFGTRGEEEGRIYLNPQAWAVLADVANEKRARLAMESVARLLETESGTLLLASPYIRRGRHIGRPADMAPGRGTNGSVHSHAALFHACALAALGQGGRAIEAFRRVLPVARQSGVERSRHIPIWMPDHYVAPGCEGGGLASSCILTAAVPWCFLFIREYVFGVRATPEGLTVRPCVPASWRECRLIRRFRGDEYEIVVRNPHGLETGRVHLELDGQPLDGDLVPPVGDGRHHRVVATLEVGERAKGPQEGAG